MEKFINSLIRRFKKVFCKKYFAIVSVFVGVVTVLGFSYGYLSVESGWQLALQLRASKLYYSIRVNYVNTNEITVAANSGTTYYDVEITALNDISTRYVLTYKVTGTATVAISSTSANDDSGLIGKYRNNSDIQKVRTVRIAVTNNSSGAAIVTLSVAGGYTWNSENQVTIATGFSKITDVNNETSIIYGQSLADEIAAKLNCTPTADIPCSVKQNSNNYLTYGGYTWRIIGTYVINNEKVVKLVLADNYGTQTHYSATPTTLSTFYSSMTETSLVRTSSPFNCERTGGSTSNTMGCTGSANYGLVSLHEYGIAGLADSFLYTKPNEDFWLMDSFNTNYGVTYYNSATSRGNYGVASDDKLAFIRPSIYLKANTINSNTSATVGIESNPYTVAQGVAITVNGLDDATANITSGYLAAGSNYTLSTPVHTNSNYTFSKWVVISGTGSSINNGVLTMGTGATVIAATWKGTYNYTGAYDVYTATAPGYYYVQTYGAAGGHQTRKTYGGYSSGYINLSQGDKLYVYVGGVKQTFNCCSQQTHWGSGGATDIRYFGSTTPSSSDLVWDSTLGFNSRIMVAGGGGGTYGDDSAPYGSDGGGLITYYIPHSNYAVMPASQTAGGAAGTSGTAGTFGKGGTNSNSAYTSGAGGYYGGGSGPSGGGGSSFISGYAGSNAITSASNRTHTNNTLHYSGKYFINGTMKAGVRSGNGQAIIEYVGAAPQRTNTKLNNVRYIKDCATGNPYDGYVSWREIQAIKDGTNIAKGKTISNYTETYNTNRLPYTTITDGILIYNNWAVSNTSSYTEKCVTVDLGSTYNLDEVAVWHIGTDNGQTRGPYYNNVTYVSSNNSSWTELINETIPEPSTGKRVNAYGEVINGYMGKNLVVWYDGISNTGTTRSTSTTSWKNLAGTSYNGTITSGSWGTNYLSLGASSKVDTGINLVNNYTPQNNTTLEIVMKVTSWTNTNTQYGNAGIVFGSAHYGGYGITWSRATTSSSGSIFAHKRSDDNGADIVVVISGPTLSAPTAIASYSISDNYSGNVIAFYTSGSLYGSKATATGQRYDSLAASSEATIGINNYGTYGGNYVSGGSTRLPMYVYSARLYNRALTAAEIYHNYLVDKERFELP